MLLCAYTYFLLFFIRKICRFIIFISFFDDLSNFLNRITIRIGDKKLSAYYKHFYLISCFHDQRSHFYSISVIISHNHKTDTQKMWEEYFKWKVCKIKKLYIENKRIVSNCSPKRVFASIKGHLSNPNIQVEVKFHLIGISFW